ncbi:NAD(P)-binding protein [Tothia fuscella]|uniref:NAD(P)-binding protein n=1 Tax=Tothia fuscella TaxID=1048955 RepID=A0A9P4NSR4_9PEZI|nr:NAD(P)-binding protein [Tothia fuscella]
MATPYGKTKDGFEQQFGTNHLGHFLFFQLLKPTLLKSASADFPSRVVSLSSVGHRSGEVRLDDFNFTEKDSYSPWAGYGQAKTANIYLANEIERRYGPQNLHATSLHPGGISTGLQVHSPEVGQMMEKPEVVKMMKSPSQGASTSVYAALSEEWKHKGGKYLSNCVEMPPADPNVDMLSGDEGYAAWAYDEEKAKKLWEKSLELVGIEGEK